MMDAREQVKQILLETIDKIEDVDKSPNYVGKKKATFELDPELHRKLKLYAAIKDTNMVDVVEEALISFLKDK